MRNLRLIGLVLLLSLVIPALTALAQDGGEWDTFTSEDETLSFNYPKDWFVDAATEDVPVPAYAVGNTEDALAKLISDEDIAPDTGEVGLIVLLLPADFVTLAGVDVPADAGPGDLALALVTVFTTPDEGKPAPELSDPVEVELTDEITAGQVHTLETDGEGQFTVFTINEDVIVVSWVGTAPGEFTDELGQLGVDFAKSVSYTGTGTDLMAAIMGGTTTTALDGNALIDERCTVCHTRDRIDAKMAAGADLDAWTTTVDRMIGKGAQLSDDERQAVLDYLTGAGDTGAALDGDALVSERCTVCHTRDRIDAKVASGADLAAWTTTVDRMIGKGAQLSADERQAVLDYLTSTN
jgi:mono/diheme cytochrome c family protein